jgi:predicted Zn-dependent protease
LKRWLIAAAFALICAQAGAQEPVAEAPPEASAAAEPVATVAAAAAPVLSLAPRPAPSRVRPDPTTDEGGIWDVSDRTERDAQHSGERIRAEALETYVRDVSCKVAGEFCGDIRLYLMQRPFFNASMAPNGYMEVWSGLMLRAENEAQLAFVLGHEITHYSERHSLDALRALRARANGAMIAGIGLTILGAAAAANNPASAQSIMDATSGVVNIVYLGAIASFFGFTRENETEADARGFDRAVGAGYDPQAGAQLWTNLIDEVARSDFERTRNREARGSIFATHPLSRDRVEALQALAQGSAGGATERARYRAVIRPHLGAWLRDELRRRDYGQTLFLLDRLGADGEDAGLIAFYRGEAHRLRRGAEDLAAARTAYEAAIAQPDAPPEAWRQLGDVYARDGRNPEASAMLSEYLTRAPAAADRLLIERRISGLGSAP